MSAFASPIARPSVGRTFIVAISLLGLIALAQLAAMGWVFVNRFQTLTERAKVGGKDLAQGDAPGDLSASATAEKLEVSDPFLEAEARVNASDAPIPPPSKPVPVTMAELNPPPPPPETRFQELLQQGRKLRERGDMAAAMVKFREAQTLESENAEAMMDIAVTFERMAQHDKAGEQWRKIYEMGEQAGAFFQAADARLKMSQAQLLAAVQMAQQAEAAKEGPVSSTNPNAILGIGQVTRSDKPDSTGVRFVLRVPIKGKRTEKIVVPDVDIQVFFYDRVDGNDIVQTDADLTSKFSTSPVDWAGSEPETLEINYSRQPPVGKGARPEQREYYGYIVRVYHKGELQDFRSEPDTLNEKFPAPQNLDTPAK